MLGEKEVETEEEEWKDDVSIIDGEIIPFYFEKFLKKSKVEDLYPNLKPHHIKNLYDIYYSKNYQYLEGNSFWEDILSRFDKSTFKFLSNHDPLYCDRIVPIFCKYVSQILFEIEEEKQRQKQEQEEEQQQEQEEQESEESQNEAQGQSEEENKEENSQQQSKSNSKGSNDLSEAIEQIINDNASQATAEAEKAIQKHQEEEQKKQQIKITSAGKAVGEQRCEADPAIVRNLLSSVNVNSNAINEFIKKTINKFREHFSNISKFEIEPILEAEEIVDIEGLELLPFVDEYPFLWEEIYNIKKLYSCVVDCYLDNSGSIDTPKFFKKNTCFIRQYVLHLCIKIYK
jgi:hypothetical protein